MYFAKFTKIQFYILSIRYISQKYNNFASNLKNGTKLLKIFNINKLNLQIMETLKELNAKCTLIAQFRNEAFVIKDGRPAHNDSSANIAKLYYDNEKKLLCIY